MIDFSLTNILLTIFVGIPIVIVLTGLVVGTISCLYLLMRDFFSYIHHPHDRGAH